MRRRDLRINATAPELDSLAALSRLLGRARVGLSIRGFRIAGCGFERHFVDVEP